MRFIQAELAYVAGKKTKLPAYRILRTTGPHGLGVALMTWQRPYQDLRMAMLCRFGKLFKMKSTAVWQKANWKVKKRPDDVPPESREAAIASFPAGAQRKD